MQPDPLPKQGERDGDDEGRAPRSGSVIALEASFR
jgi:hypothetical protein